ncbi:MAG: hypothetical protein JWM28_1972 [Chitinophagaceae bacterium]|nr:hypothetical protein [Chitinophagaceae bacterium]
MTRPEYKTFHPATRQAWRQWLQKNHQASPGIWMIYYKKESGKHKVSYAEAVEEALCFGWIDSLPRKLDKERAMLKFTPRKPKSSWSALNKKRVRKLVKNKLMKAAGLAKINRAKKDGSWRVLDATNYQAGNNLVPADILTGLNKKTKALANFKNFPLGYRRRFLFWIDSAKQPGTRKERIKQTALMAAANKKPGINGFKL